jgi:signal transduction histidine kinase
MKVNKPEFDPAAATGAADPSSAHRNEPLSVPSPSLTFAQLRHEMRTPLNQIIGFTDLLIEDADAASNRYLAR